jgi:hypothetical protein
VVGILLQRPVGIDPAGDAEDDPRPRQRIWSTFIW